MLGAAEAVAAGDVSVAAAAFLRDFFAGDGDVSAPAAAGEASAVAAFFRDFLAGEADASAVAGEALATGEASVAVAAFFFECLAGEAEAVGVGDWALTRLVPISPITIKRIKFFVRMNRSLRKMDANEKHKNSLKHPRREN